MHAIQLTDVGTELKLSAVDIIDRKQRTKHKFVSGQEILIFIARRHANAVYDMTLSHVGVISNQINESGTQPTLHDSQ